MTESSSPLQRAKEFFRDKTSGQHSEESSKSASKSRRSSTDKDKSPDKKKKKPKTLAGEARESMEAVVVAFILAFLFRTYVAEAFVIPTGSMAPTLLGRNKEAYCPQCGQHIVVGASDEIDQESSYLNLERGLVDTAFCPNCRYQVSLLDAPVFTGDRILVTKFPYELGEPDRFDVIVFKYPQDPQTNYIKRLVGLPGEEIQISQGDVYVRKTENGKWRILRKQDPNKQRVLQLLVYDNDHPEVGLHEQGWPKRWAGVKYTGSDETNPGELIAGWEEDSAGWEDLNDEDHSFRLNAEETSDGELRWLRYRHIVPEPSDWEAVERGATKGNLKPWERLQLITDFCGYNAYTSAGLHNISDQGAGYYWVGDLTINARIQVENQDGGEIVLELNEGPRQYRCRIDLSTGTATLFYPDVKSRDEKEVITLGEAETSMQGTGTYDVTFANVDNRLCLWVDDELIDFGVNAEGTPNAEYTPFGGENVRQPPTDRDLIPVGIAARGADIQVSRLKLQRDIYYRGESISYTSIDPDELIEGHPVIHEDPAQSEFHGNHYDLMKKLSNPEEWYEEYRENSSLAVRFDRLGDDEYFVLGDNSPRSKDSRLWTPERPGPPWQGEFANLAERPHSVPRDALVGKAFYIYWPHGKPFLNGGNGFPVTNHKLPPPKGIPEREYRLLIEKRYPNYPYPNYRFPFYPDFGRMERIR